MQGIRVAIVVLTILCLGLGSRLVRGQSAEPGSFDARHLPALPASFNLPRAATEDPAQANGSDTATPDETNLGLPSGLRQGLGGEPTKGEAESTPSPVSGPELLDKLLGREEAAVKIHGWIENSFTGNTNGRPPSGTNFALFPNHLANQWMGNQYYLIVENPLELTDKINFGFRVDTLFGNDWTITHSYGLFNNVFTPNSFRGLDFPQIYGEVHLPVLTKGGLEIKGGRFYSIAGYETVPATGRPLLSWPYLMTFTPFTFVGAITSLHLTDRINIYNGAVNGPDRWIDQNYRWSYLGGLGWTSKDSKTTLALTLVTGGANQLPRFAPANTPLYPTGMTPPPFLAGRRNLSYNANVMTYLDATMTRQWSDRLTEVAEAFVFSETNAPGFGPGGTNRNIAWYGGAHWFLYNFTDKMMGTWRAEIFRDNNGAATGVADTFYEMTLGMLYKPREWLWIRPETRYDWAQFKTPFSDGTRGSRFTIGFDVIVLF